MDCNISTEEFQRLQEQLLDLRTTNYSLIEENRKISNELKVLQGAREQERPRSLDAFTPKKLNEFRRRFMKSDEPSNTPSSPVLNQEIFSQEESVRKENENLQREFRSLVEVNQSLQSEIAIFKESRFQSGEVSVKEFEILSRERIDLMQTVEQLRQKIDQLEVEVSECRLQEQSVLKSQQELNIRSENLQQAYEKVYSEKEDVLLDLSNKQTTCDTLDREVSSLYSQLESERSLWRSQAERQENDQRLKEEAHVKKCQGLENEVQSLKDRLETLPSLESTIQQNQVLLESYKEKLLNAESREEESKMACDELRSELEKQYGAQLKEKKGAFESEKKALSMEIEVVTAQLSEMESTISRLKQELEDAAEDRKLDEKKGTAALRDLKRQLLGEKKRVEKLQERLKEVSPHEISQDGSGSTELDRYSVSSWSVMSGDGNRAVSRPKSTKSSCSDQELPLQQSTPVKQYSTDLATDINSEIAQLVTRMALLQEEKAILEERIRQLESSGATVAEELIRRGKLIERYCMDGGRTCGKTEIVHPSNQVLEKLAIKMNGIFPKHNGTKTDEQKQQMVRLLEETLTKNMHLQDNIEMLVQEIQKLKIISKNEIS